MLKNQVEQANEHSQSVLEVANNERMMKKIDSIEYFSGLGFFSVSRATLKSMCSTAITYLIILIQFKSGTPVTPRA